MKNERTHAWAEDLRTPGAVQITGRLYGPLTNKSNQLVDGDGVVVNSIYDAAWGHCCLGRGCDLAGIPREGDTYLGGEGAPPATFHQWLGIEVNLPTDAKAEEWFETVWIDWGEDLADREGGLYRDYSASCDALNDSVGLTFPQIADLIDYFGVVGIRP